MLISKNIKVTTKQLQMLHNKQKSNLVVSDCNVLCCLVEHMVPPVIRKLITNIMSNLHT